MAEIIVKPLVTEIDKLRAGLETYHPVTKDECIKFIHLRSAFKAEEGRIAKEAYHFLENRCGDCEVHESDGLSVLRIQPEQKTYNSTPELRKAEAALEKAKAELEIARLKAGFKLEPGTPYYKVTKRKAG